MMVESVNAVLVSDESASVFRLAGPELLAKQYYNLAFIAKSSHCAATGDHTSKLSASEQNRLKQVIADFMVIEATGELLTRPSSPSRRTKQERELALYHWIEAHFVVPGEIELVTITAIAIMDWRRIEPDASAKLRAE